MLQHQTLLCWKCRTLHNFIVSENRVSNEKQSQSVYFIIFTRKLSNCSFLMLLGCFHGFWPGLTELKSSQVQFGRNAIRLNFQTVFYKRCCFWNFRRKPTVLKSSKETQLGRIALMILNTSVHGQYEKTCHWRILQFDIWFLDFLRSLKFLFKSHNSRKSRSFIVCLNWQYKLLLNRIIELCGIIYPCPCFKMR